MKGRVLIVAGSDSSGGAGIQADIKTVTALGGYAATAITALTAQNSQGVFDVMEVPIPFVVKQMELTLSDIGADVIKTGMLHNAAVIDAVAGVIAKHAPTLPLVVDPVLASQSGSALLDKAAVPSLIKQLVSRATIVTPNIPEAEILAGMKISNVDEMTAAGRKILALGARAVLVKGGHLEGNELTDVFIGDGELEAFHGRRIQTKHTHGTGCTLASAIACCLARGMSLRQAVMSARAYVRNAIKSAPGFGQGHGPLKHYIAF